MLKQTIVARIEVRIVVSPGGGLTPRRSSDCKYVLFFSLTQWRDVRHNEPPDIL